MTDRRRFLEKVRSARSVAELPRHITEPPPVAPPTLPTVSPVEHFVEQLEAVDGTAHLVTAMEVPALVRDLVDRYGGGTVMAWDEAHLGVPGVVAALHGPGISLVDATMPRTDHPPRNREFDDVRIGITGATAGLAESGSIVVVSGPGRPRMASLIPLVHIAILPAGKIHRSLTDFLVAEPEVIEGGANVVAITGPSRTADIEQNLNLGVHGPGHVHVIIVGAR